MNDYYFKFKEFTLKNCDAALKVNFDGVLLGAWVDIDTDKYILDLGTGTGVIAHMLAQKNTASIIYAIDVDAKSVDEANFNVKLNDRQDQIIVERVSVQDFKTDCRFDHIVCNPPYFQNNTKAFATKLKVSKHGVELTFSDIITASKRMLNANGKLSVILPLEEAKSFLSLAISHSFNLQRLLDVKSRVDTPIKRKLMTFSRNQSFEPMIEEIYVHEKGRDNYSEKYKSITKDFYLKF